MTRLASSSFTIEPPPFVSLAETPCPQWRGAVFRTGFGSYAREFDRAIERLAVTCGREAQRRRGVGPRRGSVRDQGARRPANLLRIGQEELLERRRIGDR